MSGTTAARPPAADVIVVAAGGSQRMAGRDKLAAIVAGRPLLAWTLDALAAAHATERIVIVAAADRVAELSSSPWLPAAVVAVVAGGQRRQDSVVAGVRALDAALAADDDSFDENRLVLVHDGARPLVTPRLVDDVARAAAEHGAAIPVLPVSETLKRVEDGHVAGTLERDGLATAQTPQGVRRGLLRRALTRLAADPGLEVTDEAALLAASDIAVHALPGDPANFKVTLPGDIERVASALTGRTSMRAGFGTDRHPFGPGLPLSLGGIDVPGAPRLHGHSDGDVALHALASALLSAAGLGDLGRLFPADGRTPSGIGSRALLRESVARCGQAGWRAVAVSLAIEGARPRLGDVIEAMRDAIAELLGLETSAVAVTASSGNLASEEGAGRSISATALVTLATLPPDVRR